MQVESAAVAAAADLCLHLLYLLLMVMLCRYHSPSAKDKYMDLFILAQ